MAIAPINLQTLRWSREMAGYPTIVDACENINFLKKKNDNINLLTAWENGEKSISASHADNLARAYGLVNRIHFERPTSYLQEIIPDIRNIQDFRMANEQKLTPNLIRFLREVMDRHKFLVSVAEHDDEDDASDLSWVGAYKDQSVTKIAQAMRQLVWEGEPPKPHLSSWIEQVENRLAIAVMQPRPHHSYSIKFQISGLALHNHLLPATILNINDNLGRRLFTLCHEIAHLMIGEYGLSAHHYSEGIIRQNCETEGLCDRIAETVLMPKDIFITQWQYQNISVKQRIQNCVDKFGVSYSASAVRARHLGLIDENELAILLSFYKKKYQIYKINLQENAARRKEAGKKGGGALPQWKVAIDRVGPRMIRQSLQAYDAGRLSALDLHDIFKVKLDHLPKIAEKIGHPLMRWHGSIRK